MLFSVVLSVCLLVVAESAPQNLEWNINPDHYTAEQLAVLQG